MKDALDDSAHHGPQAVGDGLRVGAGLRPLHQPAADLLEEPLLVRRQAQDAEAVDQGWRGRRVDGDGQKGDAGHGEKHFGGLRLAKPGGALVVVHRHRKGQAQRPAEASPGHDHSLGLCHRLLVHGEPLQQAQRGEDEGAADGQEHEVDHHDVAVVREADVIREHRVACEHPGDEEDGDVAQPLHHVPDVLHGLLADDERPHVLGQHQRARHGGEHAADVEDELGQDEAHVRCADGQQDLEHAAVVLQLVPGKPDPGAEEEADKRPEGPGKHHGLEHEHHDVAEGVLHPLQHVVGDGEHHHGCPVVEQRLALDLYREHRRGAKLLEKGHDGDGVGGAENGGHRQAQEEGPLEVELQEARAEHRADEHARPCQVRGLAEGALRHGRVDGHRVARKQGRQQREEEEVRVDPDPHLVRRAEDTQLLPQVEALHDEVGDHTQDEEGHGGLQVVEPETEVHGRSADEQRHEEEEERAVRRGALLVRGLGERAGAQAGVHVGVRADGGVAGRPATVEAVEAAEPDAHRGGEGEEQPGSQASGSR
mmetsp:Transcript_53550/g.116882  ORF Transcript_53550/g.116882 Transcript_53550/m.116882 type:complete len:538 (+) Transcript_53550:1836-3449(+)